MKLPFWGEKHHFIVGGFEICWDQNYNECDLIGIKMFDFKEKKLFNLIIYYVNRIK
jgi:hypothetical protein